MKKLNFLVLIFSLSSFALAQDLTIYTEDSPPFQYSEGGKIKGIASDIISEVMKRSKVSFVHEMIPWSRAYSDAKSKNNTCVYSTTVTEDRKPLFKWVGPLVSNDWVIFLRNDSSLNPKSLSDLKGMTIGGYLDDAVANFLKKKGHTVDEATNDGMNPKKLMAKRVDAWATSSVVGPYLAKTNGVKGIKKVLTFKKTVMSLACNKGISDDVINKLSKALEEVRSDGTMDKIRGNYK